MRGPLALVGPLLGQDVSDVRLLIAGSVANLRFHEVSCAFGTRRALDAVSFELAPGVTGLLGVNGAGKSTLMRVAAGVLAPDAGQATVDGLSLYDRGQRGNALADVAWVPQEARFPERFTCREALFYFAWLRQIPRGARPARVEAAAGAVDLQSRLGVTVRALSGGERRRLAIAQALLTESKVLLLDEPTTGLDPHQRSELRALVARIAEDRLVLLASHIVEDIDYLAERLVVLHGGQVRFDGTVEQLSARGSIEAGVGTSLERGFLVLIGEARSA